MRLYSRGTTRYGRLLNLPHLSHLPDRLRDCARLQKDTKVLFQQLTASQAALKQADVQVCILEEQIVSLKQVSGATSITRAPPRSQARIPATLIACTSRLSLDSS